MEASLIAFMGLLPCEDSLHRLLPRCGSFPPVHKQRSVARAAMTLASRLGISMTNWSEVNDRAIFGSNTTDTHPCFMLQTTVSEIHQFQLISRTHTGSRRNLGVT